MHRIAIFASGQGTNAQRFIDYFRNRKDISVSLIVCNNREAGVVSIAYKEGIPVIMINKESFYHSEKIAGELKEKADFIVLAGFLWKIPANILRAYQGKIVNIHPALLPKYGGKGMYGSKVHETVLSNGDKESGITIHYVNENYDEGRIIFQAKCPVDSSDTPETLAKKVHELEYKFYPLKVEELLKSPPSQSN